MSILKRLKTQKLNINTKLQEVNKDIFTMPTKDSSLEEPEYEIVEKEILPEKMICPDCGGITLVGLDFCDKCGGELMNQDS